MRMLSIALVTLLSLMASTVIHGQLLFDFEDGEIALWGIEGDGSLALETANGNPGNSLRVNEPATGATNYIIAHPAFSGDWTGADATDSIHFDLFPESSGGSLITNYPYLVELRGPGGIANLLPNWVPVINTWQSVSLPIDPTAWTMVSGDWNDLVAYVDMVRIRAEFISGNEVVLLDNIGLSFTPGITAQQGLQCSTFEPEDGLDGWNIQNAATVTLSTTVGEPPNSIQIGDQGSVITLAYAPPKFRGDLSVWNGVGDMRFDVRVNTSLTTFSLHPHHVRIAGPGGEATVPITEAEVTAATNQWSTFIYPLDDITWTITSGDWNALLANVTTIELALEYYFGTAETVFLDNFCIGDPNTGIATAAASHPRPTLQPNPAFGTVQLTTHLGGQKQLDVLDAHGRQVATYAFTGTALMLGTEGLAEGVYQLRLNSGGHTEHIKLVLAR